MFKSQDTRLARDNKGYSPMVYVKSNHAMRPTMGFGFASHPHLAFGVDVMGDHAMMVYLGVPLYKVSSVNAWRGNDGLSALI
jgi:hypothetical protein